MIDCLIVIVTGMLCVFFEVGTGLLKIFLDLGLLSFVNTVLNL
jgi:hypothetical protein